MTASTVPLSHRSYDCPLGTLTLVATDDGLRAILWPDLEAELARTRLDLEVAPAGPAATQILDDTTTQLDEYFAGDRFEFDLPLDPRGTDLQRETWLGLADIAYGETTSYGDQASALGRPSSVRAVAGANGKNPVSIVLPCHRVVGANGKLTGFAAGLEAKAWLLDHERRHCGATG